VGKLATLPFSRLFATPPVLKTILIPHLIGITLEILFEIGLKAHNFPKGNNCFGFDRFQTQLAFLRENYFTQADAVELDKLHIASIPLNKYEINSFLS
jgi:hypothetical protein